MATEVLILGGGFAGVSTAAALERKASNAVDVTLVSRDNYFLFTPMLPEVAGGSIEPRHIVQPLRRRLRRTKFVLGNARAIDLGARSVEVEHPVLKTRTRLHFDQLVIALGAEASTLELPGIAEHTVPLKTLDDALALRGRIVAAFEAAAGVNDRVLRDRELRFVVVGAGFTGVELAGELTGFLRALRCYYPALAQFEPEIVLVESEHRVLAELPERFGKYAAASLRRRGVELVLGDRVASADERGLLLSSGKRYESATVVWTAGVKPSALVASLGLQTSKHGALLVNGDLSVPGVAGVWGLGDCAQVPKPKGGHYAPLAQNAVREGPLVARNIAAVLRGDVPKTFRYRRLGMMASLGERQGLAELPGRRMVGGFPAWLMWHGYYLSRLPGTLDKVRVGADWALSVFSRSAVARLALLSEPLAEEHRHAS